MKLFKKPLFWVTLVSILPVLALFHAGMPYTHDGMDHVARIANFYAVLKEGIIVPRWAPNLNWGYGHPILMFLYPLPEYIASLFHAIGFSLVDSTKLVFGLAFMASAITMYLWMNAAFGTWEAIAGTILYQFAPYRFVDFHVRGALGEHVAFVFPPLVLYFILKKRWALAAVALAALILAHNAISLMFLPIIGLYGLYLLFREKKKLLFIIHYSLFILLGFGLSAFFWIPALLEGRFTLRDIVIAGESLKRFVPWTWFFYPNWSFLGSDNLTKFLGFGQWIGIIAAVVLAINTKVKKTKTIIIASLALLLLSLGIMTSVSLPVWRAVKILQDFQFPWRFLSLTVFIAAVLGGIAVAAIKNRNVKIGFCMLTVILTSWMWRPAGYQIHDDSFYSGIYPGTTDTGESSPIWSTRFMEHTAANPLDVVDGDATVTVVSRTSSVHEYRVTVRKPTLLVENTLYFPGWEISVNGIQTGIEWQNPTYRGLMTFRMTPGNNQLVRVTFGDTKVRKTADWVSIGAVFLWLPSLLL